MEPIDIPSTSPPEGQDRDYTFSLKRCSDKVRERGLDVEISFPPNKTNSGYPKMGPVNNYLGLTFFSSNDSDLTEPHNVVRGAIEFGKLKYEQMHGPTELYLPINRLQHCQICKSDFDKYFEHIETEKHQREIKKSVGNSFVMNLCAKFQGKGDLGKSRQKELQLKSAHMKETSMEQQNIIDCDEVFQGEQDLLLKGYERNDDLLRQS